MRFCICVVKISMLICTKFDLIRYCRFFVIQKNVKIAYFPKYGQIGYFPFSGNVNNKIMN